MHTLTNYLLDSILVSGLVIGAVSTLVVASIVAVRMLIGINAFINRNHRKH